jgi:hypothetical protein
MDLLGHFEFSDTIFTNKTSFVKEVNMMNIATDLNQQFNESIGIFKSYLNKIQKEDVARDILIRR